MKAFLLALAAMVVISAAVYVGAPMLGFSSAEVYSDANVRLD